MCGRFVQSLPAAEMETWMVSPRVNVAGPDDEEMLNSL